MNFDNWLSNYLGCEYEDLDRNLNEDDLRRAFIAGQESPEKDGK